MENFKNIKLEYQRLYRMEDEECEIITKEDI